MVIVGALAVNVAARAFALPIFGAATVAQWAFAILAFAAFPALIGDAHAAMLRRIATRGVAGFVTVSLAVGFWQAAEQVGGVTPVLGWPTAWRYLAAALLSALGLAAALTAGRAGVIAAACGVALALWPVRDLPVGVGVAVFALALALRVPVALALLAGVLVSPGPLSDAAFAQTVMRGLSAHVLLAVPLFVLAAALMVAGGIGARIVAAARWLARSRRSALGEANVIASLLFGGVSGSSIADAAMGARLLVPGMVQARYPPAQAAAVTAAAAVLPNVLPPSIALLLAAAATDQSVGALWLSGLGAGAVLTAALWLAVRLTPPPPSPPPGAESGAAQDVAGDGDTRETAPRGRTVLMGLGPPLAIAIVVLGGLRLGLVTAVEAGLLAVAVAALFAVRERGLAALVPAVREAGVQTGRVGLLIAAATPVGFLFATSGADVAAVLPGGPAPLALLAAAGLCLLVGTVLDVGAAILLVLPVLVPACAAAGADPVHAALVLSIALLLGGLTPPVGMLVLVTKDIADTGGVYRAILPYLLALGAALGIIMMVPAISVGLADVF